VSDASIAPESTYPSERPAARGPVTGLIIDWGGVMTNPILDTVNAWLDADGIERSSYVTIMRSWVSLAYGNGQEENPIHALERGECEDEEFERLLAGYLVRLDGGPVSPVGLLDRMFAATVFSQAMQDVVRRLRRAGLRTALLSNSWGRGGYPRELFPELFDAVVISREVGMRKPEERIFRHAVDLLGLPPGECVFIDDIEANVTAAEAIGLIGLHHVEPSVTVQRLSDLLGIPLDPVG
jgi:putative hydrolase of the HAD superfamily